MFAKVFSAFLTILVCQSAWSAEAKVSEAELKLIKDRMRAALEIKPLQPVQGQVILRIHDDRFSNLTITAEDSKVVARFVQATEHWPQFGFYDKFTPSDADRDPRAAATVFEWKDLLLAEAVKFLVAHAAEYRSEARGLDGGYYYIAAAGQGEDVAFEVWSPDSYAAPAAHDLSDAFNRFSSLLFLIHAPKDRWEKDKGDVRLGFPGASARDFTRAVALDFLQRELAERLRSMARTMKENEGRPPPMPKPANVEMIEVVPE
jgi:hypothetical protein